MCGDGHQNDTQSRAPKKHKRETYPQEAQTSPSGGATNIRSKLSTAQGLKPIVGSPTNLPTSGSKYHAQA
jgi:hypothetical protein